VFRTSQTDFQASHASAGANRVVPMTQVAFAAGGDAAGPPRLAGDAMGKEL
jgi:hypothetical protein